MVTYFNKKDLVKFGEYLLSDERKARMKLSSKTNSLTYKETMKNVYHADIENWLGKK